MYLIGGPGDSGNDFVTHPGRFHGTLQSDTEGGVGIAVAGFPGGQFIRPAKRSWQVRPAWTGRRSSSKRSPCGLAACASSICAIKSSSTVLLASWSVTVLPSAVCADLYSATCDVNSETVKLSPFTVAAAGMAVGVGGTGVAVGPTGVGVARRAKKGTAGNEAERKEQYETPEANLQPSLGHKLMEDLQILVKATERKKHRPDYTHFQ